MRMQKLVLILIMLTFAGSLSAQSGWQWLNPTPTGNNIGCIQKINSTLLVAFGYSCSLKSTNNGETWIYKELDYPAGAKSVKFFDVNTGYLHRYDNTIAKTTNGGNNWQTILSGLGSISFVKFPTVNYGLAVHDRSVYKTTNGGENWFLFIVMPNLYDNLTDIYSPNESIVKCLYFHFYYSGGNVSIYNRLLQTSNGGASWTDFSFVPNNDYDECTKICFADSLHGFIIGSNRTFFETYNGGTSWTRRNLGIGRHYGKIDFINSLYGYMISTNNVVDSLFLTTNAGINWIGTNNYSRSAAVCVLDGSNIVSSSDSARLFKSTNFGISWINKKTSYTDRSLYKVQCVSDSVYYTCGYWGTILKTSNGGVTWSNIGPGTNYYFTSLHFINQNTGIASTSVDIYRTTNGGINWNIEYTDSNIVYGKINSIFLLNNNTGFMVGKYGKLRRTNNGGLNWIQYPGMPNKEFSNIDFINNSTGFVSCLDSSLYKTSDGGTSWFPVPGTVRGNRVKFINQNTGFLLSSQVGDKIYRTEDGGNNWASILISGGDVLNDITFIDQNTGYVAGGTSLLKTTDKGLSWAACIKSSIRYYSLSSYNGYAVLVGADGLIKTTKPIPNVFINNQEIGATFPDNFILHQNYPNPFNPSTKINYEIKSSGFVSLKVFDLLGKEVAMLVNEKQNAGSYAIDFNSTEFNLPSGVYFYTLNAGEFKETKKMVLVK